MSLRAFVDEKFSLDGFPPSASKRKEERGSLRETESPHRHRNTTRIDFVHCACTTLYDLVRPSVGLFKSQPVRYFLLSVPTDTNSTTWINMTWHQMSLHGFAKQNSVRGLKEGEIILRSSLVSGDNISLSTLSVPQEKLSAPLVASALPVQHRFSGELNACLLMISGYYHPRCRICRLRSMIRLP